MRAYLPVLLAVAIAPSLSAQQPVPASESRAAMALAERCGVASWPQVERLAYTFNFRSETAQVERAWEWEPQSGRITYRGQDAGGNSVTVTYRREEMANASDLVRQVDRWFINDQYWLLFPFHLKWDDGVLIADDGRQPLPIGEGEAERLRVIFSGEGGYTPGDVYELSLGRDGLIEQWAYRHSGTGEPRPMTWEGYAHLGPLTVSLEHLARNRQARLFFSEVSATIGGEEFTPQPL